MFVASVVVGFHCCTFWRCGTDGSAFCCCGLCGSTLWSRGAFCCCSLHCGTFCCLLSLLLHFLELCYLL